MKSLHLTLVLAGLVLAFSCNSTKKAEAALSEYYETSERLSMEYMTLAQEIALDDSELSEEEAQAALEAKFEEFVDYAKRVVKRNTGNEAGVAALRDVYFLYDDEELSQILDKFGVAADTNEVLSSLKQGLAARKLTAEGQMFVDFSAIQDDGDVKNLSDYVGRGKYVLVDFWASWCMPCREETSFVKDVYDRFAGEDFDVLSVAVADLTENSLAAAEELGITWNQIVNTQEIALDTYGIESIPHIILFGPDGTILKRNLRGLDISQEVSKYVSEK